MFRLIFVCALTALSGAMAGQARAQAANPEPGYCAQFYPNSDCNSIGPATPGAAAPAESEPAEAAPPPAPKKPAAKKNKKPQTGAATAPSTAAPSR
jgi:hypothetical protein